MPEATFTGRSVLTTGATGRISQAVATEFGRRGGHVLAAGRDRERGKTVARQIRSHGGRANSSYFLSQASPKVPRIILPIPPGTVRRPELASPP